MLKKAASAFKLSSTLPPMAIHSSINVEYVLTSPASRMFISFSAAMKLCHCFSADGDYFRDSDFQAEQCESEPAELVCTTLEIWSIPWVISWMELA